MRAQVPLPRNGPGEAASSPCNARVQPLGHSCSAELPAGSLRRDDPRGSECNVSGLRIKRKEEPKWDFRAIDEVLTLDAEQGSIGCSAAGPGLRVGRVVIDRRRAPRILPSHLGSYSRTGTEMFLCK